MSEPIWTPTAERVAASNLARFAEFARREHGAPQGDYGALWRWSVEERERFWSGMMEFAGILRDDGSAQIARDRDRMPGAVWFPGTELNYAERLFRGKPGGRVAIRHASESRPAGECRSLEPEGARRRAASGP